MEQLIFLVYHTCLLLCAIAAIAPSAAAASCDGLASLSLPDARIRTAESVSAGDFTPPSFTQPIHNLPALCRVAVTLNPTTDSDIKVVLPTR